MKNIHLISHRKNDKIRFKNQKNKKMLTKCPKNIRPFSVNNFFFEFH